MTVLPQLVEQPRGSLAEHSLPQLLLAAQVGRLSGTLILEDASRTSGRPGYRLGLVDGIAVAGDAGQSGGLGLHSHLIRLGTWGRGRYRFSPGQDLIGAGPHVLRGRVDPYTLYMAVVRTGACDDRLAEVLEAFGSAPLAVRPDFPLARFALTRDEWNFVQDVKREPGPPGELILRMGMERVVAQRILYLLAQCGALVVAPTGDKPAAGAALPDTDYGEADLDSVVDEDATPYGPVPPGMEVDGGSFEAERLHHQAVQYLEQGRFTEALDEVNDALRMCPVRAESQALKGFILWRLEADPLAPSPEVMALFDRALELDPHYAWAHYYRGRVLKAMGRAQEAMDHFCRAIALDPHHHEAFRALHQLRQHSGQTHSGFWQRLRRGWPGFSSTS